jgi:hypothetical protein
MFSKFHNFYFTRKILNSILRPKFGIYYISHRRLYPKRYFRDLITWEKAGVGLWRNPQDFMEIDADLKKVLDLCLNYIDHDDLVLDLGCNVGRVMNYFHENRIRNLHGVDILESGKDLTSRLYPELAKSDTTRFFTMSFFDFFRLPNLAYYDCVITVGATIELINPYEKIIKRMCENTRKFVFCYINENSHSYPKLYIYEFYKENFDLIFLERLYDNEGMYKNSILIFKNRSHKKV